MFSIKAALFLTFLFVFVAARPQDDAPPLGGSIHASGSASSSSSSGSHASASASSDSGSTSTNTGPVVKPPAPVVNPPAPVGGPAAWISSGKAYSVGDQVTYNGAVYRVIQAHTSQSGWTPSTVASLWKKV